MQWVVLPLWHHNRQRDPAYSRHSIVIKKARLKASIVCKTRLKILPESSPSTHSLVCFKCKLDIGQEA
jgi:hypothetical protein